METIRVNAEGLQRWTADILRSVGVRGEDARQAAEVLAYADERGLDTHGVFNLERIYVQKILKGEIDPGVQPEVIREHGATAVLDGRNGLGLVVARQAMLRALDLAARFGVGAVAVRRSTHFGPAGYYSSLALERGMIGLAMTNLGGQAVAPPPGGTRPLLGTNPLSLAAPTAEVPPFVLDMSTTAVAAGKVRQAQNRGESIPQGWLADEHGRPITDPARYARGDGYLQFAGGVKGYGLAVLVEILAGVLAGAALGPDPAALADTRKQHKDDVNIGHFFLALDVKAFRPEGFPEAMDDMLGTLLRCPSLKASERVQYAGYQENGLRRERLRHGVPLDAPLYQALGDLGRRLGVAVPGPVLS